MALSSVGLRLLVVTGEVMIERASEVVRACDAVEAKSPRSGGSQPYLGSQSARLRELIRAAAACRTYAIGRPAGGAEIRARRWMARSGGSRSGAHGDTCACLPLSARRAAARGPWADAVWLAGRPRGEHVVRTQPPHGAVGARLELHAACSRQGSRSAAAVTARGTSNNAVIGSSKW
jgi:hypothetical protein